MQTHEINRLAVGDSAKAVREALRALGKRCSLRWIYYQCEPAPDVRRLDVYGAFWRFFQALWKANRQGAEILFEDFRCRVQALRHDSSELCRADWYAELERCEIEQSEALRAAIRNHDLPAIKKEVAEAIAAYRRLLAIVEARGACLDNGRAVGQEAARPASREVKHDGRATACSAARRASQPAPTDRGAHCSRRAGQRSS